MKNILISVIIPVYNAEKTIETCVNSLLNQNFNSFEIILVNDGSTDNSRYICEKFSKNYTNIKLINKNNGGPSSARNEGIKIANGKYISFVDSDDKVSNNYFDTLTSEIQQNIELYIFGFKTIKINKIELLTIPKFTQIIDKIDFDRKFGNYYLSRLINSPCNKLYKNIFMEKEIFFDESISIGEDLLFNLTYLNQIKDIKLIKETIYNYIIRNDSITRNYNQHCVNNQKKIFKELIEYLEKNNSNSEDNLNLVCEVFFNRIFECLLATIDKKSDFIETFHNIVNDKFIVKWLIYYKDSNNNLNIFLYSLLKKNNKLLLIYLKSYSLLKRIKNKIKL